MGAEWGSTEKRPEKKVSIVACAGGLSSPPGAGYSFGFKGRIRKRKRINSALINMTGASDAFNRIYRHADLKKKGEDSKEVGKNKDATTGEEYAYKPNKCERCRVDESDALQTIVRGGEKLGSRVEQCFSLKATRCCMQCGGDGGGGCAGSLSIIPKKATLSAETIKGVKKDRGRGKQESRGEPGLHVLKGVFRSC